MDLFSINFLENGLLTVGGILLGLLLIKMGWNCAQYVFFGGDDQHRLHAKAAMQNDTSSLLFLLIIWAIFAWIAGAF